jgi:predicted DNA-binding transcriptional regulator YafY
MNAAASQFSGAGRRHRTDVPTEHLARISWMMITLLCDGVLDHGRYRDLFGTSPRQFQRDLRHIRELGRPHGFDVTARRSGRVFLVTSAHRITNLGARNRDAAATLARLAVAFGGPIASEMREAVGDSHTGAGRGFLQIREPLPSADEHVTAVFEQLKAAAAARARVEFAYTSARGASGQRRVEPYHIVERSGRYYLVAYDILRRDWRFFALDAVHGTIVRAGSFSARAVPERLLAERAVGWIGGSHGGDVTIQISRAIATAVGARRWQEGQRFCILSDGTAELAMHFGDLGEAVRFSLGFGAEATIVAPPEAVALARETAEHIAETYAPGRGLRRKLTG